VQQAEPAVADLATGIGQAIMAVREAIERFRRQVLVDTDTGALEETSADMLDEARRTVAEAEARLPRVRLAIGDGAESAIAAVTQLREALDHVQAYLKQPWGGEWSEEEIERASEALAEASLLQDNFVERARGRRRRN
jgi:hypothetical protein